MRDITPASIARGLETGAKARKFLNNTVKTTDGRSGVVFRALPLKEGNVQLWVREGGEGGTEEFVTDSEHATLVK